MISDQAAVGRFLEDFKIKLGIWGILFRDHRSKNTQTILLLEISTIVREQVLKNLQVEDYSEGPLDDTLYGVASMWVFGKTVKGHEIYIKISMGAAGSKVICISFHIAEGRMKYPHKQKQ